MNEAILKAALQQSIYLAIAYIVGKISLNIAKRYEKHLLEIIKNNNESLDKRDLAFEKLAEKYDIVLSIKENTDKIPYIEEDVKELKYNNKIGVVRNVQQT